MTKVQIVVSDADDVPTAVLVEYTTVYIDPQSIHTIDIPSDRRSRSFQYGSSMMNESNLHAMESHIITILQNMNEEEHIRNNIQKRICKRLVFSIFFIGVLFVGFYMVFHKEARSM
jgi:hypothetical protein